LTSTITDVTNAANGNDLRKDSAIRKRSSTTTTPIRTKSLGIPAPLTRLYFYWSADDHWVAASTRDQLIAARGRNGGGNGGISSLGEACKPVMEIDRYGIPHAFPVVAEHGRLVAGKVAEWIGQIVAAL